MQQSAVDVAFLAYLTITIEFCPTRLYARGEPILRMTGVDGQHASAGFALP